MRGIDNLSGGKEKVSVSAATNSVSNMVKLIVGMLSSSEELFGEAEETLGRHFGEVDFGSQVIPFTYTSYYEKEMGKGLLRKFISFTDLIDAGTLADTKNITRNVEKKFSLSALPVSSGNRRINIDPGYVGGAKLVLATTKNYDHRVYLKDGIYAEVTLHFRDGSFGAWPWTYPDYNTKEYIEIFSHIRKIYLEQLKGGGRPVLSSLS